MTISPGGIRLARLLKLIPFLQANSGISVSDTALLFNISEEQLISDLNLIWLCGLPGYSHLELIDVSYDSGTITIQNAQTIARPMRLGFDDGISLLLAIENLLNIVPSNDALVLNSLRRKILQVLKLNTESTSSENLEQLHPDESTVLPTIMQALSNPKQLVDFQYYSATLDSSIGIQIIPQRFFVENGFTYLAALTWPSQQYSVFRVDRIERATLISSSAEFPDIDFAHLEIEKQTVEVTVEIASPAHWFIEKWGLTALRYDPTRERYVGQIHVFNHSWLIRAALSLGGALEVVAPKSLREEIASAARSALEKYREPLK